MKQPSFFRFFIGQMFSSFGDWVALVAIVSVTKRIYDNEFAVAAVLLARLAPAFFFGPVAGAMADRFDRKKVMVACDVARAALILTLPFIESISSRVPLLNPVVLLLVISAALEMLTLLWQPAKDASVPDLVANRNQYTHAYSLLLIAAYMTFPLSGVAFGLLAKVSQWLGSAFGLREFVINREQLAFFLDSLTFLISAGLTLTLAIPHRPRKGAERMRISAIAEDVLDGVRFVYRHSRIRPWVIGIGGTFAGVGAFISMTPFFIDRVLGGGAASFGFMVTAVGGGLGVGFLLSALAARFVPKDVLFSIVVMAMGIAMIGYGSMSTLSTALVLASVCGLFGGFAYPTGYALVQEALDPDPKLRGRASAAVNSVIRLAVVGAAAAAPAIAKLSDQLMGDPMTLLGQSLDLRGVRVVMWIGGVLIVLAGLVTTRAVSARWKGVRFTTPGVFFVFEGGEGSGKSTQIQLLAKFLEEQGRDVVITLEPGGTPIGMKIREMLLDPENEGLSDKAEALLYAADRAQHVDDVIRPALLEGKIVISDRYVDSSLAYQGLGRDLGLERIMDLSSWATGGLMPDLVFLLDYDAERGLRRAGVGDRIENEGVKFHSMVRQAYRILSSRFPERFEVIDADQPADQIALLIQQKVIPLLGRKGRVSEPAK